jgi:hypothetical protein
LQHWTLRYWVPDDAPQMETGSLGDPGTAPVAPLVLESFRGYLARRLAYYQRPPALVLRTLLDKDVLLYAFRGVATPDELVEQAFAAHESSSEETMWGHAWQAAIAAVAPNTVGGGDLRTERDGTLWIIQLKTGTEQNSAAEAQDLRLLKTKVRQETDHHPGRRNVKAMYAIVRGKPRTEWRHYRATNPANRDIDGFQYEYRVGADFLAWASAAITPAAMIAEFAEEIAAIKTARRHCIQAAQGLLRERLQKDDLPLDIAGVLRLTT